MWQVISVLTGATAVHVPIVGPRGCELFTVAESFGGLQRVGEGGEGCELPSTGSDPFSSPQLPLLHQGHSASLMFLELQAAAQKISARS